MTGRPSAATEKALALIGKKKKGGGVHTAYSAAKECQIALSTIYRALLRASERVQVRAMVAEQDEEHRSILKALGRRKKRK